VATVGKVCSSLTTAIFADGAAEVSNCGAVSIL